MVRTNNKYQMSNVRDLCYDSVENGTITKHVQCYNYLHTVCVCAMNL